MSKAKCGRCNKNDASDDPDLNIHGACKLCSICFCEVYGQKPDCYAGIKSPEAIASLVQELLSTDREGF